MTTRKAKANAEGAEDAEDAEDAESAEEAKAKTRAASLEMTISKGARNDKSNGVRTK